MEMLNQVTDDERLADIKVERIYVGEKTVQQLVIELLKKRREAGGPYS